MKVQDVVTQKVPVKKLVLDNSVQMRADIDMGAVRDYADAMSDGEELPPVIVFHRQGSPMYVADGFHRVKAAQSIKAKEILCEIHDGSRRDAILFAAGANARHGVRRTNNDKRRAVTTLLKDKEWARWTDSEIARRSNVSATLVAKYRELLGAHEEIRQYVDRTGRLRDITVIQDGHEEAAAPGRRRCRLCGQLLPDCS